MTYAQKLALAAELRAGTELESGFDPFYLCHPGEWHESAYLPDGYEKTMVPLKPAPEDLTALNPANVKRARKVKAT